MDETLVLPDVVEEVEVSTITGCYMSGEKDPYSQIDFSNIEHILDFSSLLHVVKLWQVLLKISLNRYISTRNLLSDSPQIKIKNLRESFLVTNVEKDSSEKPI